MDLQHPFLWSHDLAGFLTSVIHLTASIITPPAELRVILSDMIPILQVKLSAQGLTAEERSAAETSLSARVVREETRRLKPPGHSSHH